MSSNENKKTLGELRNNKIILLRHRIIRYYCRIFSQSVCFLQQEITNVFASFKLTKIAK